MLTWHIITGEYPPVIGGVSDYCQLVAEGLAGAGMRCMCGARRCPRGRRPTALPFIPRGTFLTPRSARGRSPARSLPPPRRLLVQWVPHAFGYRSLNVGFCLWLRQRARRGDRVEIMVHEPYLAFGGGALRWTAAASVHRLMTVILARAACRIWIAIPDWERRWRPYLLGRDVPFTWLPVPSSLPEPSPDDVRRVRDRYALSGGPIVGHLGLYGSAATRVLSATLPEILRQSPTCRVPARSARSSPIGNLPGSSPIGTAAARGWRAVLRALAQHVRACDVLAQPYPDGISSRRTSAMAGLALGVPVVTTPTISPSPSGSRPVASRSCP